MTNSRLTNLPDDILFLVLANLGSARDIGALGQTCRHLQHLVRYDGWRIFVRSRFPSLAVPAPAAGSHAWQNLADSLTWQSRCWDRRSLQFQALLPQAEAHRDHHRPVRWVRFMPPVDAHLNPTTRKELVVWGAGEDIVARYRQRRGRDQPSDASWHRLNGKDIGFGIGYDDVNTIKVVEYGGGLAMVTGRHNGQLSVLSADPKQFGKTIAELCPAVRSSTASQRLFNQDSFKSLDVLDTGSKRLLAAAAESSVRIYGFPEADAFETAPVSTYELNDHVLTSSSAKLNSAKWMEQGGVIAMALMGSKDPLRYLSLTPTGWTHHVAAKSERVAREFNINYDKNVRPHSLEPVYSVSGARRGTSLLLSSWRDRTIRLQDLRTPSAFDAVYQNNVDPRTVSLALMAYGTERFISGGLDLAVDIFDFRWPRSYHHTAGLPCHRGTPFPRAHQPFLQPITTEPTGRALCDHVKGQPCHWHGLSKGLYYRPNAKLFLSQSLGTHKTSAIWSFARASDVSPNFYIAISGAILEANLEETPETYPPERTTVDPNFGFPDWRAQAQPGSGYKTRPVVPALMETGDGYSFKRNDRTIRMPGLRRYQGPREWTADRAMLEKHHRLDIGYHEEADFAYDMA